MNLKTISLFTLFLFAAQAANAAIMIDAGDHTLLANTPNQSVSVLVSSEAGDSDISGMNLRVEIGDGVGTLAEPVFQGAGPLTGLDFTGSVFDLTGSTFSGAAPASAMFPQFANAGALTDVDVTPDGVLVNLILDTTGFGTAGEVFDLRLGSFVSPNLGDTELLGPIGSALPLSGVVINNGFIRFAPIPEPASLVLLLMGTAAAAVTRRRR